MSRSFRGVPVSPGVAIGKASILTAAPHGVTPPRPEGATHEAERSRVEAAIVRARDEIRELRARVAESLGERQAAIIDAQVLVLDDPALRAEIAARLADETVSAEAAASGAMRAFASKIAKSADPYLRERAADLTDIERRVLKFLAGTAAVGGTAAAEPAIVVAHSLGPSDTVALARDGVVGLAADLGGPTSHTAILARAFGLPAVIGLTHLAASARAGVTTIVDGDRGVVIVDPGREEIEEAERRRAAWLRAEAVRAGERDVPAVTVDGVSVTLRANVEFPEEAETAQRFGATGIGLYRSEFLFVSLAPRLPAEDDHFRAALDLAGRVSPHPVVVRTLDLGGEKYFHEVLDRAETNPVLGLRGLRLCLTRPEIFVPQIRGLLRAAARADVRILLPFVTSADEIHEVRKIVAREAGRLQAEGTPCRPDVPIGAMIETPAAAMTADLLAKEADFVSAGTNDLVQYALAVDRGNPSVATLYDPLHPAVLRMLRFVVRAARARTRPVSICGEMAGSPAMVPALIGLGFRELSCPPRALPRVREAVRAASASAAAREVESRMESAGIDQEVPR